MHPEKIGYLHAYTAFWKCYGDFGRRTSKEAFWKAWVVHSALILALSSPTYFIYRSMIERGDFLSNNWLTPYIIYCIATLVPTIAIIVRRLNDIDRNGGWFFFFLIPVAGQIAFFIMLSRSAAPYDTFPGRPPGSPYARQPYGPPVQPYARQPYGPPVQPYAQQPYGPPAFKLPLLPPRRYTPPVGGNSALISIALSIIIAVASSVYSGATTVFLFNNIDKFMDRYIEALFGDIYSGFGDNYGDYNPWGWDYGPYEDWSNPWEDEWNNDGGGGNADDDLSDEDRTVIDYVKESMLPGFPEFTIEEVLLLCVQGEVLEWECFVFEEGENPSYCIFAMGSSRATDSVYAEFKVQSDGTIDLDNFFDGARDEYGEDAVDLYGEWYEKMLSDEDDAFAA